MKQWIELYGQVFSIAFVAGTLGNLFANLIQSIFLHLHIGRVNARIQRKTPTAGKASQDGEAS